MFHWGQDFAYITERKIVVLMNGGMIMPPDVETLLYSGRPDENNVDICEGDTVEAEHLLIPFTGEIVFKDGSFCIDIMGNPTSSVRFDIGQTPELSNFETVTIIGNKYEGLKK